MKELDLMLERFLDRQGPDLIGGGWPELEALLDAEDDRLWDWLRHPSADDAAPYRRLLENIRGDAR